MACGCHDMFHLASREGCSSDCPLCLLPDSLLLEIFSYVDALTLASASQVSHRWYTLTHDQQLWRGKVISRWGLGSDAVSVRGLTWRQEYERLYSRSPVMLSETLTNHTDEVLHVSFSHRGHLFATTSKDCSIKVWSVGYPTSLRHSREFFREYGWDFTQFSAFNASDTMLMVSSVCGLQDRRGYVAVLALDDDFTLLRVVSMDPSQLFGTWLDDWTVLGGSLEINLERFAASVQIEAFQVRYNDYSRNRGLKPSVETNIGYPLFNFCSETASLIKFLTIVEENHQDPQQPQSNSEVEAKPPSSTLDFPLSNSGLGSSPKCAKCDVSSPCKCLHLNFQKKESSGSSPLNGHARHEKWGGDGGGDDDNDEESLPYRTPESEPSWSPWRPAGDCSNLLPGQMDPGSSSAQAGLSAEVSQELTGGQHWRNGRLSSHSSVEDKESSARRKLLYVTGEFAVSLHQIGIKSIPPGLLETWSSGMVDAETESLGEDSHMVVNYSSQDITLRRPRKPDVSDHMLDFNGHVTGLCLSRDHRYLIVNCRPWAGAVNRHDPWNTPELSGDLEVRVIDLNSFTEVGPRYKGHRGFSESDKCCFVFLDACQDFIASGSEDSKAYLWDRHHACLLATFPHGPGVVNAVAFCPSNQEYLVSVSDDHRIRIWRSRRLMQRLKKSLKISFQHTLMQL